MSDWTTVEGLRSALDRRWRRGELLTWLASGGPWTPVRVPLAGPSARQVTQQYAQTQAWVEALARSAGRGRFRLELRRIGGRLVGVNELPCAAWFDEPDQVWGLLGVTREVATYRAVLAQARERDLRLADWAASRPMQALEQATAWSRLLDTALWLRDHAGSGLYLRQIDVPGVDTKFVERHRAVLADLVDALNPDGARPDPESEGLTTASAGQTSAGRFARRHGLADKPKRVRVRSLDGRPLLGSAAVTDVAVRVDELAREALDCQAVLAVENEVTFLALPAIPATLAVFGAGFDVLRLGRVGWLADRRLVYWGDLDTHGFVILDSLRGAHPHVESVLMDEATLLAHRLHWGAESAPSRRALGRLTPAEAWVHHGLVHDRYAVSLRLEQERVSFTHASAVLVDLLS